MAMNNEDIALVGFDFDNKERTYGASDPAEALLRQRRNQALYAGTLRLYQTYVDLVKLQQDKILDAQASNDELSQILEALLIPLIWRNSQTEENHYRKLLEPSRVYWEGKLDGFPWPTVVPDQIGMWSPLGSFGYYYFHYGVVNSPVNVVDYVAGALSLYWQFLRESTGLSLTGSPSQRWQEIKTYLGWRNLDYGKIEQQLLKWLRGDEPGRQLEMRRRLLSPQHFQNLERRLLLGLASPNLIQFLDLNAGALTLDNGASFQWDISKRWNLGPGGVTQVLLSFVVEGLLLVIQTLKNAKNIPYLSFIQTEGYQDVLSGLALTYDALELLGGLYRDIEPLQERVFAMLITGLKDKELATEGAYRLISVPIGLNLLLEKVNLENNSADLSWQKGYSPVTGSQTFPQPGDFLYFNNPPKLVRSGVLEQLRIEGRPGLALSAALAEDSSAQLYTMPVLINEQGYALVPVQLVNFNEAAVKVILTIFCIDYPSISNTITLVVEGQSLSLETLLPRLKSVNQALNKFGDELSLPVTAVAGFLEEVYFWSEQLPEQRKRERELSEKAGAPPRGGTDLSSILGALQGLYSIFSQLRRTNPVSTPDKQQNVQEQKAHFAAAADTEQKLTLTSENLEQALDGVQPKVEPTAPAPMRPALEEYGKAVEDAGKNLVAAAQARAVDQGGGRTVVQSNEVWQVNSQQARIQTTGNFEVSSPNTVISSQLLNLQTRHRIGIHDLAQDTAQFLWYRATKQRQMVAEHNIDYNNNWYKGTSANAHYVAGHHSQYGDELLVMVGQTKKNEETEGAAEAEAPAEEGAVNTELSAEIATETLPEIASSVEEVTQISDSLDSAKDAITQGTQTLQEVLQNIPVISQGLETIGALTGGTGSLGALGTALESLGGNIGGALSTLIQSIPGATQSMEGFIETVSNMQALVEAINDPQTTMTVAEFDEAMEPLIQAAQSYISNLIQTSDANELVKSTATQTLEIFTSQVSGGAFNQQITANTFAPYLSVIGGAVTQILGQTLSGTALGGVLNGLTGSGGIAGTVSNAVSGAVGAIINGLPIGSALSSSVLSALGTGFTGAATSALGSIANLAGLGTGLTAAGDILEAFGFNNIPKLHKQNSQVGKYGHYVIDVYKELAIEVKRGGFRVKTKKDIGLVTRLGKFNAQGLRTTIIGTLSMDVVGRLRTSVRGRVVTIKADKVLYLDAPKIICSTLPVVGNIPALSAVTSLLTQVQTVMEKVDEYMGYIKQVMDMLGVGGELAAPMESPAQIPTSNAPVAARPISSLADQNPTGGALPAGAVVPQKAIPLTTPYSPTLARYYYRPKKES